MPRKDNRSGSIVARRRAHARFARAARIVVAAVAAFAVSSAWYAAFAAVLMESRGAEPEAATGPAAPAWLPFAELARNVVVATVLARLAARANIAGPRRAVGLGLWLWLGFPATILAGAAMWNEAPWPVAMIHAGDWLLKLTVMAALLSPRRRRNEPNRTERPTNA